MDITIFKKNNRLITNWFQKLTSSRRVINFSSNHPIQQKKNIIYNLVDRAILLSHKKFHKDNLRKIQKMLRNNNYTGTQKKRSGLFQRWHLCTLTFFGALNPNSPSELAQHPPVSRNRGKLPLRFGKSLLNLDSSVHNTFS